jgi:hypothetical protein
METTVSTSNGAQIGKLVSPTNQVEIPLASNQLLTLDGDRRGQVLMSSAGSLWITQEGDEQDYLLKCGERFTVTRRGKVLVQGQPEGRLRIPTGTVAFAWDC